MTYIYFLFLRFEVGFAMSEISRVSCITFEEVADPSNQYHVYIKKDEPGCVATVAYLAEIAPQVRMNVNLDEGDADRINCFVSQIFFF